MVLFAFSFFGENSGKEGRKKGNNFDFHKTDPFSTWKTLGKLWKTKKGKGRA